MNLRSKMEVLSRMKDREILQYRVGGLLYMPAYQENIVEKIRAGKDEHLTAVCFCLEDAIHDAAVEAAERSLRESLCALRRHYEETGRELPLLFVRVRTADHMQHFLDFIGEAGDVLTGYVLPKVNLGNVEAYMEIMRALSGGGRRRYIMPVLESPSIADIKSRAAVLGELKAIFDAHREYVLNIRVGGNDFSNLYGVRRSIAHTIYEVGVVRDILVDILNIFARDYVVSGPVWNYFGDDPAGAWAAGLKKELELDRLNGFIGKTVIHPAQLPFVFDSLKVGRADYEDARMICNWQDEKAGVKKSWDGTRMNEVKTHAKWAKRVLTLADIYGMKDDGAAIAAESKR